MRSTPSSELIRALHNPAVYEYPVEAVQVMETHISWVLLTGPYAYKIKKPVDLGFVDFSTLPKRRFYCFEELRLNRRLAPHLYLDVVPVTGTVDAPRFSGEGEPIEFAVKMKQFRQEALLSHLLASEALLPAHVDTLAQEVADFHIRADVAAADSSFGTPESVWKPVAENFQHFAKSNEAELYDARIHALENWSRQEFETVQTEFAGRKQAGCVRECHGDMHLGNMILEESRGMRDEGRETRRHGDAEIPVSPRLSTPRLPSSLIPAHTVTIFDCIEFNENLRWIDVLSETAFCTMDLEDRGRRDFAHRFLNGYLEFTGDYTGLVVLPFYLTYRALVRAKVACLRLSQEGLTDEAKRQLHEEFHGYLQLAERFVQPSHPALMITHGVSGSGKTSGTQPVVEQFGAIRVRSDVERKRLHGLEASARTGSGIESGLYAPEVTRQTYDRLSELAVAVLRAGFPVIVDATFLKRTHRDRFRHLAAQLGVPFLILDFQASEEALRERLTERKRRNKDPSEATLEVLTYQRDTQEPFSEDERSFVMPVITDDPDATSQLVEQIQSHRSR